jgi:deazaflavin-dependent oxidoreductase (nitroreductase family)
MARGTTQGGNPRGLLRLALRLPIWLYRFGLGWLLGERFVMLTHIGRKTGRLRQTVVEVVRYDSASSAYIIASGWGSKSDWFRNIQHAPDALLHTGRRQLEAVATPLPLEAAAEELCRYARRHPITFHNLARLMIGQPLAASEAECRALAQAVPLVVARPREGSFARPVHNAQDQ